MVKLLADPLGLFQRIYIINLASRADRRLEMAEQLKKIGLSIESSNVHVFNALRPSDPGPFSTIGTRGCFLSHLGVLRDAQRAGLERILILEDDLNFSNEFRSTAGGLFAQLQATEWAMFYGGHKIRGVVHVDRGLAEIAPPVNVETAHFLAFRGAAIAEAVSYLEAMLERAAGDSAGGPMHVDGAYSWFRKSHAHFRTFIAMPELGYQRSSRTDIHALRWVDTFPGVSRIVAALRRARNRRDGGKFI